MRQLSDIQALVERFLEGQTSNAEERELYTWFAENDVPDEWQHLKQMFAWYAAGMPEQSNEQSNEPQQTITHRPTRSYRVRLRWAVGAAAVVAVVVATVLRPESETTNIYDGSYIIKDGVRYENLSLIEDDIEATIQRADAIEHRANELLAWADM